MTSCNLFHNMTAEYPVEDWVFNELTNQELHFFQENPRNAKRKII
ncbi:MAG: hypothetical protein H6Q49_54 [Deltaproteobacteria bacterium]|nr:hypothetical protein [Deltaproteobacteria bacterium]